MDMKDMEATLYGIWGSHGGMIPTFQRNMMPPSLAGLSAENGEGMFVWNAGIYLQVHMALQSRRPTVIKTTSLFIPLRIFICRI
jgi:hypothetical protein